MSQIFFGKPWIEVRSDILAALAGYLPVLLTALGLLLAGYLLARLVEALSRRAIRRTSFDRMASAASPAGGADGGTRAPDRSHSDTLARALFWIVMLTFALLAVRVLGIASLSAVIEKLIAFVPSLLAAVAILAAGLFAGGVVESLLLSAAAANPAYASRLGGAGKGLVVVAFAILAIEQLGVRTEILVIFSGTVLMALGLTMGIAFALGARPVITHILAGHYLRQILPRGRVVEVRGRRGEIEQVGPVHTVFRDDDGAWSVANGHLLEETITL